MFDLLKKPDLTPGDIKRIKEVAVDLLKTLKAEKLRIDHWRDKEATRDAVRLTIRDYLYSDQNGLPEIYSVEEVSDRTEAVFVHVFRAYPTVPSPYYANIASSRIGPAVVNLVVDVGWGIAHTDIITNVKLVP